MGEKERVAVAAGRDDVAVAFDEADAEAATAREVVGVAELCP